MHKSNEVNKIRNQFSCSSPVRMQPIISKKVPLGPERINVANKTKSSGSCKILDQPVQTKMTTKHSELLVIMGEETPYVSCDLPVCLSVLSVWAQLIHPAPELWWLAHLHLITSSTVQYIDHSSPSSLDQIVFRHSGVLHHEAYLVL